MATDEWGIDDGWIDTTGEWRTADPHTIELIRGAMGDPRQGHPTWVVRAGGQEPLRDRCHLRLEDGADAGELGRLPADLPLGIHTLTPLDGGPPTSLVVSPGRCHLPADLRSWGLAVQVPTTWSRDSWGIGDLRDVRRLCEWVDELGGGAVTLSPLHAPTPIAPVQPSPYYPSSRRFRSPLLISVDDVPGAADLVDDLGGAARNLLRAGSTVDRDRCWDLKREALERIWRAGGAGRDPSLGGDPPSAALTGWARFCALAERHGSSWHRWPPALRHPGSPAVDRAAEELRDRVAFHAWLQRVIDRQLHHAAGASVAVIQDLAVGVDPGGADAWLAQDLLAPGLSIGAPPDEFARDGQCWGLPPFVPWRLRDAGYRPFAELLRANLVPGGGVRIDHAMGLTRLFWVPDGGSPSDGAYVRFAGRELLEVVALESAQARAIVIGEDLGTVEPGFRDVLADAGILSTRLVWFEDVPPESYPEQALAMVTTHDLPTIAGMCGDDSPASMRDRLERLVGSIAGRAVDDVLVATMRGLGASRAALAITTAEDLLRVEDRPNLPGTDPGQRANWSVALPAPIEDLRTDRTALDAVRALRGGRTRSS